jgi:hypothetical protein
VIRGLDVGIRRTVVATLREKGLSESVAEDLANAHMTDATQFFHSRLSVNQMRAKPLDAALDDSFVELSNWAAKLAAVLGEAVAR